MTRLSQLSDSERKELFNRQHAAVAPAMSQIQASFKRYDVTNHEFAKTDTVFINACVKAEVKPTDRQASRFRMKKRAVLMLH